MTPQNLRFAVPMQTPRLVTLACCPWLHAYCAAVQGYLDALKATLQIVE